MSGAYVTYVFDDSLDEDDKIKINNDGRTLRSGRRSGTARLVFGLMVFILLAVIMGIAAHDLRTLSSWHQHQIGSQDNENLTPIVTQLQAQFNNLTEKKKDVPLENGSCSLGWIEVNRKCYYSSPEGLALTWQKSKKDCGDRGGRLVTIKTRTELQVLSLFHDLAWIGLSDRDTEGSWVWEDGTELQSSFWTKGEPNDFDSNEDCAHLNANGRKLGFNDNNCEKDLPYICEALG